MVAIGPARPLGGIPCAFNSEVFAPARIPLIVPAMLRLEHLAELAARNGEALRARVQEFSVGGRQFHFNSVPAILGVINLSADSWYRESVALSAGAAIRRGRVLAAQGADVVDIGAESTLVDAGRVDARGQIERLIPVIRELRAEGLLVSAETYQPEVSRACLEAGANILNLTGIDPTEEIFRQVADHHPPLLPSHVQAIDVRAVGEFDFGLDPVALLEEFFARQIERANRCGVERIFIDPGLGFYYRNLRDSAVRVRHQMMVFLNTFRLRRLGWPICHALPHAFEYFGEEVRCAEPFFCVLAALGHTD